MSKIIPFKLGQSVAAQVRISRIQKFQALRQDMLEAYRLWLAEQPASADVAEELQGTINSMHNFTVLADLPK